MSEIEPFALGYVVLTCADGSESSQRIHGTIRLRYPSGIVDHITVEFVPDNGDRDVNLIATRSVHWWSIYRQDGTLVSRHRLSPKQWADTNDTVHIRGLWEDE